MYFLKKAWSRWFWKLPWIRRTVEPKKFRTIWDFLARAFFLVLNFFGSMVLKIKLISRTIFRTTKNNLQNQKNVLFRIRRTGPMNWQNQKMFCERKRTSNWRLVLESTARPCPAKHCPTDRNARAGTALGWLASTTTERRSARHRQASFVKILINLMFIFKKSL